MARAPARPAAGGAVLDLCSQTQQVFLPQSGASSGITSTTGCPAVRPASVRAVAKGRTPLNDGLPGSQLFLLDGQRQHALGQAVAGGAGGAVEVQIRK